MEHTLEREQRTPEANNQRQITLSGGPIAYVAQGHNQPLVLLHGWSGSSRQWRYTRQACAEWSHVYALDLPGYGQSPPWRHTNATQPAHAGLQPPDVAQTARIVLAFADALGIAQFDLVAHSFSCSVAVFVATTAPARVRRLVLTCASTYRSPLERWLVSQVHRILALWLALRRPWMADTRWLYRAVMRRFFYRLPADDRLLRETFMDFMRMDRQTALTHAADVTRIDYHGALRQLTMPVLVVGARQDQIMPTVGTPYLARLIPDQRLEWIERCGHLPMLERPDVYHRLLRQFLYSEVL